MKSSNCCHFLGVLASCHYSVNISSCSRFLFILTASLYIVYLFCATIIYVLQISVTNVMKLNVQMEKSDGFFKKVKRSFSNR
jgi:hypothetical protein